MSGGCPEGVQRTAIILTLLVASAYAGDILDLIEDYGKYEAKWNSSHNSDWNS